MIALEPANEAYSFLRQFTGPRFFCLPLAAWDSDHKRLTSNRKFWRQSSSSMFLDTQAGYVGQPACTLDSLCSCLKKVPNFIKIDVEGAELVVLRGAAQTLETTAQVLIEINEDSVCEKFGYKNGEIYDLMEHAGYMHYYDVRNSNNRVVKISNRISGDILFSKYEVDFSYLAKNEANEIEKWQNLA